MFLSKSCYYCLRNRLRHRLRIWWLRRFPHPVDYYDTIILNWCPQKPSPASFSVGMIVFDIDADEIGLNEQFVMERLLELERQGKIALRRTQSSNRIRLSGRRPPIHITLSDGSTCTDLALLEVQRLQHDTKQ